MSVALERPHAVVHVPQITTLAVGTLFVYAFDAWVLEVEGDTSPGRRALYLALIALGAASAWYASGRLSYRLKAAAMLALGLGGLMIAGPIVFSHIDKLGFEGSALTGVLAILGSLVLVAIGTARLLKIAKGRIAERYVRPPTLEGRSR
jgi:hypothetical protein